MPASTTRLRRARCPRSTSSAPASPTTPGCSRPTASTPTSPPSPSGSSRPPRTTCGPCATSAVSSTATPARSSTRSSPTAPSTSAPTPTPATPTRPSSSRLPSPWSGGGPATTGSATRCTTSPARTSSTPRPTLDADGDGWPEGAGNVERAGQGAEKLDNAVYLIRGELDFAEMARSKGNIAEAKTWQAKAAALMAKFEQAWWFGQANPGSPTPGTANAYADSLQDPGNIRIYQRYWTGVVPMEAELWLNGTNVPRPRRAAERDLGSAAPGDAVLHVVVRARPHRQRRDDEPEQAAAVPDDELRGRQRDVEPAGRARLLHPQHGSHGRRRG